MLFSRWREVRIPKSFDRGLENIAAFSIARWQPFDTRMFLSTRHREHVILTVVKDKKFPSALRTDTEDYKIRYFALWKKS